jgi:hypothetical protein
MTAVRHQSAPGRGLVVNIAMVPLVVPQAADLVNTIRYRRAGVSTASVQMGYPLTGILVAG